MCIICEKILIFIVFTIFISVLVYHVFTPFTTLFSKSYRKLHRESLEKCSENAGFTTYLNLKGRFLFFMFGFMVGFMVKLTIKNESIYSKLQYFIIYVVKFMVSTARNT